MASWRGNRGCDRRTGPSIPICVTFLIGCSFTFETPLQQAGIEVRHIAQGRNVPMYLTNRDCRPAGRLHGKMVVSMRPIPAGTRGRGGDDFRAAPRRSWRPIHIGAPGDLGIADPQSPISAMPSISVRARCRCSGPAGDAAGGADGLPPALRDHPCRATCSSPTSPKPIGRCDDAFLPIGPCSFLAELADLDETLALFDALNADPVPGVAEIIPAARTLMIRTAPGMLPPMPRWRVGSAAAPQTRALAPRPPPAPPKRSSCR